MSAIPGKKTRKDRRARQGFVMLAEPSNAALSLGTQDHDGETQVVASSTTLEPTFEAYPELTALVPLGNFSWDAETAAKLPCMVSGVPVIVKAKERERSRNSDHPMLAFLPLRDEYGEELMRLEGRGGAAGCLCPGLHPDGDSPVGSFRCRDCFGGVLRCSMCIVGAHQEQPLHTVEEWKGGRFVSTSLRELGLVVQLGHPVGERCQSGLAGPSSFTVIHTNGLHQVAFWFCDCSRKTLPRTQLLRFGLWPATPFDPHSAASIQVLRAFHHANQHGQITASDFYRSLKTMTDARLMANLPDRLRTFILMAREYRHLKMLKRAGRFFWAEETLATKPGELAHKCRSCPWPGVNSPTSLSIIPAHKRYQHTPYLHEDANFRLKNRATARAADDPPMGPGMAFMVDPSPFGQVVLEYIKKYGDKEEVSTCAGFQALALSSLKLSRGLLATGVGGVCCDHGAWRPTGLVDLQKGERYVNMTYALLSALAGYKGPVLHTYDINCQFSRNFWERVLRMPIDMQILRADYDFVWKIPKMHLHGHELDCQAPYSMNFTPGAAKRAGEIIETNWPRLNNTAASTREMGPGHRRDVLDDHIGFHNWEKHVKTGARLASQLLKALPEAEKAHAEFIDFDSALRLHYKEQVQSWEDMYNRCMRAELNPNALFESAVKRETLAQVRARMAVAEARDSRMLGDLGEDDDDANVSANLTVDYIALGLRLEAAQQKLLAAAKSCKDPNPVQERDLAQRRRALHARVVGFGRRRRRLLPRLPDEMLDVGPVESVEHHQLWLPSAIPHEVRAQLCPAQLADVEKTLRRAAMADALESLKYHLRNRTFMNNFKVKHVRGQRTSTRTRTAMKSIDERSGRSAAEYRRHWDAHLVLAGEGEWTRTLHKLENADVRGLNERALTANELREREHAAKVAEAMRTTGYSSAAADEPDEDSICGGTAVVTRAAGGETGRTLSWIWTQGALNPDDWKNDPRTLEALRIEWAKSKARAARALEECGRTTAEMQHTLEFGRKIRLVWLARAEAHGWVSDASDATTDASDATTDSLESCAAIGRLSETPARADDAVQEGLVAYALEHAAYEEALAAKLETLWSPIVACARESAVVADELADVLLGAVATGPVVLEADDDDEHDGHGDLDVTGPRPIVHLTHALLTSMWHN